MGVFKEEANQFEELQRRYKGGLYTAYESHQADLETLRQWMRDMTDLKVDKRQSSEKTRVDDYFIAWEEEGSVVFGTRYSVHTTKMDDGSKLVQLESEPHRMDRATFDRFFGN
jgi:hypothetical protein